MRVTAKTTAPVRCLQFDGVTETAFRKNAPATFNTVKDNEVDLDAAVTPKNVSTLYLEPEEFLSENKTSEPKLA